MYMFWPHQICFFMYMYMLWASCVVLLCLSVVLCCLAWSFSWMIKIMYINLLVQHDKGTKLNHVQCETHVHVHCLSKVIELSDFHPYRVTPPVEPCWEAVEGGEEGGGGGRGWLLQIYMTCGIPLSGELCSASLNSTVVLRYHPHWIHLHIHVYICNVPVYVCS